VNIHPTTEDNDFRGLWEDHSEAGQDTTKTVPSATVVSIVTLENDHDMAKAYQVRQVLMAIDRLAAQTKAAAAEEQEEQE